MLHPGISTPSHRRQRWVSRGNDKTRVLRYRLSHRIYPPLCSVKLTNGTPFDAGAPALCAGIQRRNRPQLAQVADVCKSVGKSLHRSESSAPAESSRQVTLAASTCGVVGVVGAPSVTSIAGGALLLHGRRPGALDECLRLALDHDAGTRTGSPNGRPRLSTSSSQTLLPAASRLAACSAEGNVANGPSSNCRVAASAKTYPSSSGVG